MQRAMAWAATFGVIWAILEIVLGAELRGSYNLLQIVWWRYGVHLCLVALIWGRRNPGLWRTPRPVTQVTRSLLMLIMPGAFTLALMKGVPADFVWSEFWITPLLIICLGGFFLRERPPMLVALASVVGALAAAMIFGHLRPPSVLAPVLALAVAGSFSAYVVMTRSLRSEPTSTNLFHTAATVFVLLTPVMPFVWVQPGLHDAVILTMIGLVGLIALYALDRACHAAPAWAGANALFIQALCVSCIIALATHASPGPRTLIGMAVLSFLMLGLWLGSARLAGAKLPDGDQSGGRR